MLKISAISCPFNTGYRNLKPDVFVVVIAVVSVFVVVIAVDVVKLSI